jgi:hypothetical protein
MLGVFRNGDRIVAMLDLDKVLLLEGDNDKGAAASA